MWGMLVTWLSLSGLACLLPAPAAGWLGLRFLTAFCALISAVFFLHFAGSVPLSVAARIIAVVAAAGMLLGIRNIIRSPFRGKALLHPVFIFPGCAVLFGSFSGISYDPISWDELSNWLGLVQDAVLSDAFFGPEVHWAQPGYTPGWPIALAYPQLILGHYADVNSALIPFLMHVGMLGLLFDVVVHGLKQWEGWNRQAHLVSWGVILLALSLEASWKLVPLNLLVEKPQIYLICSLLALGAAASDRRLDWAVLNVHAGMLLIGGYLIKVAMLSFVAPFGVLWACVAWRRGVLGDLKALGYGLALTLIPMILAYILWRAQSPASGCLSNPIAMFTNLMAGDVSGDKGDIYSRLARNIFSYLLEYKLPLTIVAAAGIFIAAVSRGYYPVVIAIAAWLILYFIALFNYYVYCYSGHDVEVLISWERFTRLPLRVVHVMGVVLPVLAFARYGGGILQRRPGVAVVLSAGVALLAVFQLFQLRSTLIEIGRRATETPEWISTGRMVRDDAEALAALVAEKPELGQSVQMLVQDGNGYLRLKGFFHARRKFKVQTSSKFSPAGTDIWTRSIDDPRMAEILLSASLVWPVILDPWMRGVLAPLIEGPQACHEDPSRFFLVPTGARLYCLSKR